MLLEVAAPARRFRSVRSQRHFSGLWWSGTVGRHVGYESWLERDHLMLLDFDPMVVGIASQPFWLSWAAPAGDAYRHVPDFFVRRADGSAVVVDCRPADRIRPRDVVKFDATRRACGLVGWEYRQVGAPDRIVVANVRWLAGYRHPRHRLAEPAAVLREVFTRPTPLMAGVELVGDSLAVLPVLFHLLWRQELTMDLSVPLHESALVTVAG
ncbi:TnsA-like heteromeric transposase endonuclease subunit [Parafrankia sp. FMc6]